MTVWHYTGIKFEISPLLLNMTIHFILNRVSLGNSKMEILFCAKCLFEKTPDKPLVVLARYFRFLHFLFVDSSKLYFRYLRRMKVPFAQLELLFGLNKLFLE